MEYNTYEAILELITQLKLMNQKMESLESKFFHFESKISNLDEKVSKVLEMTEGVSSSFEDMNISPEQVQGVLDSFGLTGQAGGSELVGTLQTFRSKLGELSTKLSQISQETEKM
jgi:phage-related minor tail protein